MHLSWVVIALMTTDWAREVPHPNRSSSSDRPRSSANGRRV